MYEEVTSPHGVALVFQEGSPVLGIAEWMPFDHVSPDVRGGMADTELHFQLQGDAVLAVLGMIGRNPPDERDMLCWNSRSARSALGLVHPEFPELPFSPLD